MMLYSIIKNNNHSNMQKNKRNKKNDSMFILNCYGSDRSAREFNFSP